MTTANKNYSFCVAPIFKKALNENSLYSVVQIQIAELSSCFWRMLAKHGTVVLSLALHTLL